MKQNEYDGESMLVGTQVSEQGSHGNLSPRLNFNNVPLSLAYYSPIIPSPVAFLLASLPEPIECAYVVQIDGASEKRTPREMGELSDGNQQRRKPCRRTAVGRYGNVKVV
ncbi:hypothetical protein CERSUDRAFT_88010 [Gelatoporia subvermispora B]|uniref:Uncharacterized protein n=1 Tax=Ceriporiopsis subvermispora (strain B) TaxID=914234 RepID=M2QJS6_CERS8|nr:hypothetical protein CERSUDRAFT_88010 [Gelatoporia subvermispora B]